MLPPLNIKPEGLAALMRGEALEIRVPEGEKSITIYVADTPTLHGAVGAAMLEVLPFLGEKQ